MADLDLDTARRHCEEMRVLVSLRGGGRRDEQTLQSLHELSRAATSALDDAFCRECAGTIEDYASSLFSDSGHEQWARNQISGADYLRLLILRELDALCVRLAALQAARDAGQARGASLPPVAQAPR
jgi:hypothetical protein